MTALPRQGQQGLPRAVGAWGYLLAILGVGLTTLVIAVVRARIAIPNLSILYLFVILALACTSGRRAALFAAILGVFTYNFFFVEPLYTFAVHDPAEWLALLAFLVTAL